MLLLRATSTNLPQNFIFLPESSLFTLSYSEHLKYNYKYNHYNNERTKSKLSTLLFDELTNNK